VSTTPDYSQESDEVTKTIKGGEFPSDAAEADAERFGLGELVGAPSKFEEGGLNETEPELPTQVTPEGPGYMPLFCAAHWIATKGGTVQINARDPGVWEVPFSRLLSRISSNDVTVTGLQDGERRKIEGYVFADVCIDYPFETSFGLLFQDKLYLASVPYLDDEHWRNAFNDKLENRRGYRWSHLMVLKSDVLRYWPSSDPSITRTGAPGRPSPMYLVEREFHARADRGAIHASIGAEAKALSEWLRVSHPHEPPVTAKTIANRLRHEHRKQMNKARK
jgi:hypothetical protein